MSNNQSTGCAIKNHSMLEELRMSEAEKTMLRFMCQHMDERIILAPLGHIFSVAVEEIGKTGQKVPSFEEFVEAINDCVRSMGNGFACITEPNPVMVKLDGKIMYGLQGYVNQMIRKDLITPISGAKILDAAEGYTRFLPTWLHIERRRLAEKLASLLNQRINQIE